MSDKRDYINNFLKSEEFNKRFHEGNEASLQCMDTENIKNYLNLFDGKDIDENFINTEIKNNYLEGNYNLLLELYEYAIKYNFANETSVIFALFAAIKLKDKKTKKKVLKEAKKKKIRLKLFLMFTLKMQIFFQKMKRFHQMKNKINRMQRQLLFEKALNKQLLQALKQEEKDKNIAFLQEKIKVALDEKRFKDALHIYNSAYFSNYLNFDINNYGEKATKKVDNINVKDDIKTSLDRINYKIIFNEDKHLINQAIKMSAGLHSYKTVIKYENRLDKVNQKDSANKVQKMQKIQKMLNNAIVSSKMKKAQENYRA